MDGGQDRYRQTWDRALGLLARREHSEHELNNKLLQKGADAGIVAQVLAGLKQRGYLSDDRFTEAYIRARAQRGDGPLKIRQGLCARGVAEAVVEHYLDIGDPCWEARLAEVWAKRFPGAPPADYKQWAQQARFLQSRGFSAEQIRKVVTIKEQA